MLGKNFINILSEEKDAGYDHSFITKEFLKEIIPDKKGQFYLCGPPPMIKAVGGTIRFFGHNRRTDSYGYQQLLRQ